LGYLDYSSGSLSVTGRLDNTGVLQLGSSDTISSASATVGSLANSGSIDLEAGTTLQVNGDGNNSGYMLLNYNPAGAGSQAQFGSLVNSGYIDMREASNLTVVGNMNNTANGGISLSRWDQLSVGGSLTNSGSITAWAAQLGIAGGLMNSGHITLYDDSQLSVTGATNNSGTLSIGAPSEGGGQASFGSLVNSGSIEMDNGSSFNVYGTVTNSGSISALWGDEHIPSIFSASYLMNSGSIYSNFEVGWLNNSGTILLQSFNGYGTVQGNLTNSGDIALADGGYLIVGRDVINSGQITTDNGENSVNIAGRLTNTPTGSLVFAGGPVVINAGNVVNQGTFVLVGNDFNVTGGPHAGASALSGFINTGIVNIGPYSNLNVVGNYTQIAGQTTIGGNLQVQGHGMASFAGGSVFGNGGTITGPVFSSAAFNLGEQLMSVGQFSILGNYTQGPNGSLTFDIAGTAPGEYDQLNISGHAQLNGLMTVDLTHGFLPQIGNTFDIMNFASESGTFSMVLGLPINGEEHFVLEYNPTDLTLDVVPGALLGADSDGTSLIASNVAPGSTSGITFGTASDYSPSSSTPEPGSLLLLGSGLLCVGYSVHRRMTK
jgi:hypothetical protein